MCRRLGIFLLVLLAVSFSLWAFPGRATRSQEEAPTDTLAQEVQEEGQKTGFGEMQENISTEPSISSQIPEDVKNELLRELSSVKDDLAFLEETSKAKDEVIDSLVKETSRMRDESGTKAYMMVDALIGFDEKLPEYGVGLTLGARVGNSLMLEAGVDYMLGNCMADLMDVSMEDFTFRAGVGWMF